MYFFLTLLLFTVTAEAKSKLPLPYLAEGRPGCFQLIRNQALTSAQIAALPKDCQNLRSDYLQALNLIAKNPEKFSKDLGKVLSKATSARAPYEAVLFAYLLKQKTPIEKRAKVEKNLNLPFQYAVLASELLNGKECSDLGKKFEAPFYAELCFIKDDVFSEIYVAHQKSEVRHAK